jgi:HAE1 family hydrophobic/amphiphilic exporter-1
MNLSELFIRRPVMTVLLNAGIVLAGVIGIRSIPVAALPSYDTPVINVSASLRVPTPRPWPARLRCRLKSSSRPSPH